jgi:hypothetical protein
MNAPGNPLRIVKLKGGVFKLDIKKERVKLDKDSSGELKCEQNECRITFCGQGEMSRTRLRT